MYTHIIHCTLTLGQPCSFVLIDALTKICKGCYYSATEKEWKQSPSSAGPRDMFFRLACDFPGTRGGIAVSGGMSLRQASMAIPQQLQRTQLALMAAGANGTGIDQHLSVMQKNTQMFTAGKRSF